MSEILRAMARFPVRIPAKDRPLRDRRPWLIQLGVRMPPLSHLLLRAGFALPPGRVRSAIMEYGAREAAMGSYHRRDFGMVHAFQRPDVELRPAAEVAAVIGCDAVVRGRDQVVHFMAEWLEAWDRFTFIPKEVIDLGDSRVLVLSQVEARGAGSGVAMNSTEEAQLWEWQGGRVRQITQWWRSWDDALVACGLPPAGQ
jgi:hypothetical protein